MTSDELSVFLAMTERFDSIFSGLPLWFRKGNYSTWDIQNAIKNPTTYHAVIRLINLFSEEHYLNEKGLVDDEVWDLWKENLERMAAAPLVSSVWDEVKDDYASMQGFVAFMESNVTAPD